MSSGSSTSPQSNRPWVDIDLSAMRANYNLVRGLAKNSEVAAVVKCDGYGLGMIEIACLLAKQENCRTFFVAYQKEGAALRQSLHDIAPNAKIYVFSGPIDYDLGKYAQYNLTPVINSAEQAAKWASHAPDKPAALHLDLGINRLGAPLSELPAIREIGAFNVDVIMGHLSSSSRPDSDENAKQLALFEKFASEFSGAKKSLAASGGALIGPAYHFDLIRMGVALYGASPFDHIDERVKPVASLRAPVIQVRDIAAGESVGYSGTYIVDRPSRIATVALGYGDGFPRAGSSRAEAVIHGERAKIAGIISMDLITLDVTDCKIPIKTGDTATFFGEGLPIEETAERCNTIAYELLTGLGGRVDRRYV
ncbi:MAG: alanine racemase [Marinicaulis sp.]|nr:alanine racemase [Marinicaulis sp.]